MSHKVQSLKLKVFVGVILLALPLFGFGCSKDIPPVSVSTPDGASSVGEQTVAVEQALEKFKHAAAQGDIDAAMQQVHPLGQDKIRGYLEEMKKIGTLEAFSRIFGAMKPVRVGEEIAEYDVFEEGSNEPLTVTFMKDDGQWKIKDF